tara:strand:+ start:2681 stop:3226 length:546 start_codon:yes stop_codon:yes gene_type:complete
MSSCEAKPGTSRFRRARKRRSGVVPSRNLYRTTQKLLTATTGRYLENNESIVSWLCPRDSDKCSAHIPAIFYQNKYWSLSLRMSKCIYRHVRLRRGFANIQSIHGVQTLRIPQTLLQEKRRTQIRFEVPILCGDVRGISVFLCELRACYIMILACVCQKMHQTRQDSKSSTQPAAKRPRFF